MQGIFPHYQNPLLEMLRAVFMLLSATLGQETKCVISFLVFRRSLRFTESQTLSLADGTRSNCENWQRWFWCHFCLLGMQSCYFQRKQQPPSLSGTRSVRRLNGGKTFSSLCPFFFLQNMWMWQFSCEHGHSAVLIVQLKGLFQS